MKKLRTKKFVKQIIYIITILMLCSFIIPNITYAAKIKEGDGGTIFDPFSKFITFLCDNIMQFLQDSFTTTEKINTSNGTYNFQYSPAIIFSGTVQAFDINFIKPNTDVRNSYNFDAFIREKKSEFFSQVVKQDSWDKSIYEENINLAKSKDNATTILTFGRNVGVIQTYYYVENLVYYIEDNILVVECFKSTGGISPQYFYNKYTYELTENMFEEMNAITTYKSIAYQLQPTIATWYKALRRIALVGLLSVLIYIGIRIVLLSIEGKENSKYKKMLIDWLIALCLLFTLHYVMSITITITQKISDIFNVGDTDQLLNTIRSNIEESKSWGDAASNVVMYAVLTIYTITFSFQYLKRVLYMAFFTMIAPLVTLTYPLDKIKDSKAQAFTMWLREYIFNILIQVVHLVVYYTLVGSAISLTEKYPIYAIIAIGFMVIGEQIIRKMFGFNNTTAMGTLGAAATGGLISTAMNKLSTLSKPAKGSSSTNESSSNKIRTASNNSLAFLKEGGSGTGTGGSGSGANGSALGGVKALGGKYAKKAGGVVLRGGLGATGAMLGLAAGISQGDLKAAGAGLIAGGKAGSAAGKRLSQGVNTGAIKKSINNIKDTWNEGAFGADFAQSASLAREFKSSSEYQKLRDKYGDSLTDETLRVMLDADIKDAETMKKVLDSGDIGKAIGYYTLAQNCPDGIFYDNNKLKRYVEDIVENEGLNKNDAATIIRNMKMYK